MPLNGNERLKVLYDYYHLGDEGSFDFDIKKAKKVGADFRNDLCNGMVKYFPDHFEDESKFCKALFIKKYLSSLSDRFINEITSLPVHSITSIDVVPVPKDLTTKVLQKKYLGIESDIIKQQRVRNKNNDFSTENSYAKRTEKKEICNYTENRRKKIHNNQRAVESSKLKAFQMFLNEDDTIEFRNNMVSKFVAQYGKCYITGKELEPENAVGIRIKPNERNDTDDYSNIVIVSKAVIPLKRS